MTTGSYSYKFGFKDDYIKPSLKDLKEIYKYFCGTGNVTLINLLRFIIHETDFWDSEDSYFPMRIFIISTEEDKIIKEPNDLPLGVGFRVIETGIKEVNNEMS